MSTTDKYWEAEKRGGFYHGVCYHWDAASNKQIYDYVSKKSYVNKNEAEDDVCQWLEDNNIEAELG